MQLRFREDRRTLFWAFMLFPLLPALGYARPWTLWFSLPILLYSSYCAGVLTHNHAHCPVFRARRWNRAYNLWLSVFYGCPVFVWFPTHHANHHRYLNGEGDVTRTSRHSRKNGAWSALSYPLRSTREQWPLIWSYWARARARGGTRFAELVSEVSAMILGHVVLLVLAVALHGAWLGSAVYALAFGLPAALSPYWMMLTNYLQHVDCVPDSPDNHSRNFVSPLFNWFVFDNGYHTVHHDQPGLHWSCYRALHQQRAARMAERLNQNSFFGYCFEQYVAAPLWALWAGGERPRLS
jgi:fatty acid desaturase